jgi:hypothetical protein
MYSLSCRRERGSLCPSLLRVETFLSSSLLTVPSNGKRSGACLHWVKDLHSCRRDPARHRCWLSRKLRPQTCFGRVRSTRRFSVPILFARVSDAFRSDSFGSSHRVARFASACARLRDLSVSEERASHQRIISASLWTPRLRFRLDRSGSFREILLAALPIMCNAAENFLPLRFKSCGSSKIDAVKSGFSVARQTERQGFAGGFVPTVESPAAT